jgi:hypothetical protein
MLYFVKTGSRNSLNTSQQYDYLRTGQPMVHELRFFSSLDESGSLQHTQVRAGVIDGEPGLVGERFHGALALSDEVEQFQPLGAREGLTYFGP